MTVLAYQQFATAKENYITKSNNSNKIRSKTAKLSQKIMFALANGSMEITKSALHFMLYTIQFVTKDGRIYTNIHDVKNALKFQDKTLVRVIAELKDLGLLSTKDGFFYSHFHVLSNGQKSDETYVRNLSVFTSPVVLNLKKNELRFFLYVASQGVMNKVAKKVAVESLYSNYYHKGVNYIESYLDLADILNVLVSDGLIDVYINGEVYDNKKAADFKTAFHNYCGYQVNGRKQRMSKIKKHVIGLRVNPSLFEEAEYISENIASRREIEYYADQNGFFHEHMRPSTIPYIIKEQDVLFERFGLVGVQIYRNALINYFETEKDNVVYHDLYADENSSKVVNTMVDFFLLPSIIEIITGATSASSPVSDIVKYFKTAENLLALVDYFNEKGSDNHKILLDEALENAGVELKSLIHTVDTENPTENSWLLLMNKTNSIYKVINYDQSILSNDFQKRIVRQWAKEGLFTQKHILDAAVKTLKSKVVFFNKNEYKVIAEKTNTTTSKKETKDEMKKYRDRLNYNKVLSMELDF